MLDELPMLYLALVMVFILVENGREPRFGRRLAVALVALSAVVTALASTTRGPLQFWSFQISFGSLELFCLSRVGRIRRRAPSPPIRALFRVGMGAYATAVALWFVDLRFCSFVSRWLPAHGLFNPQLHAVWHVLVAAGFYALLLLVAHERLRNLGARPCVIFRFGLLPYVAAGATGQC